MKDEGTPATERESAAAISRELVSLHKQFYGRGPVRAKTFLVNDTVLCILEGGFTVVERTLIEVGRAPAVHDIRTSFQAAMRDQFTAVVESALGRRVRAYMSQVHTDPDVAVELFLLEPETTASGGGVTYDMEAPDVA
jgi:uncharacterized protein YbcI